ANLLATPAADDGPTGRGKLALVLEQARGDLGAIRDLGAAELVGVALAGILRVLHADVVGALGRGRRQPTNGQQKCGCGVRLEWSNRHSESFSLRVFKRLRSSLHPARSRPGALLAQTFLMQEPRAAASAA